MKTLSLLILFLVTPLQAGELSPALIDMNFSARPAPTKLELKSYTEWVMPFLQDKGINRYSAFTPLVFDWYQEEMQREGLPPEVYEDPAKIYVAVDRPLRQTIELEEAGEIEEGNTVGGEVYAELDATLEQALTTMLYSWGKPVGKGEGRTYPAASPFARRVEYISPLPQLGEGAFANLTLRREGGIVKDIADRYIVLVRGDKQNGFTVVMQYVKPALKTLTQQVFAMAILKPTRDGKVAYRISTRFQGQNYKMLGNVSIGRSQIGFNRAKVRAVAEEYARRIEEYKTTGRIVDRNADIEWGKP